MTLGNVLRIIRNIRGLSLSELSKITGLSKSSLSNIENDINNPTIDTLKKICSALSVLTTDVINFLNEENVDEEFIKKDNDSNLEKNIQEFIINKSRYVKNSLAHDVSPFNTAEEAMQFILSQPAVMGYGGFDTSKMSDEDKIEFANDLLAQIELLGYKYGNKNRK